MNLALVFSHPSMRITDKPARNSYVQDYFENKGSPYPADRGRPDAGDSISQPRPMLRRDHRLIGRDQFEERGIPIPHKPLVTPDRFDGRSPWREYLKRFQSCSAINGWSSLQKGQSLAASLRGPAQKVLNKISNVGDISFTELVDHLEQRYGTSGQSEKYLWQLKNCKRRRDESLADLGQSVLELTELAYPELDCKAIDRLARQYFVEAIPDQNVRMDLHRERPRCLEEAIRAAISIEAYLHTEDDRLGKRRQHIRVVKSDNEYNTPLPQQTTSTQNLTDIYGLIQAIHRDQIKEQNQRDERRRRGECFNCGRTGHIRRTI
ncbi:uncharacterized protein [Ptychodera flava]|uniref:uncharacterized protein n=1 Tax=Ptychodera flava TaxID=63121 RepID=UPI00396A9585